MTARRWWAVVGAVALVALVGIVVVVRPPAAEPPAGPPTVTATPAIAIATVIPETATPNATPSAEEEVSIAYLAYWAAYTRALRDLDPSELEAAMTGSMLERRRADIAELRREGHAAVIKVAHRFVVASIDVTAGTATVVDEYVNDSYLVDAETGEPVGSRPPPASLNDTYFLVREGTQWKVNDGVRTVTYLGGQPPSP